MPDLDTLFQSAVDLEADRLARLSPYELMVLRNQEKLISIEGQEVRVSVYVQDFSEERHIGVIAIRKRVIGEAKFFAGLKVACAMVRMTNNEAAGYYD